MLAVDLNSNIKRLVQLKADKSDLEKIQANKIDKTEA